MASHGSVLGVQVGIGLFQVVLTTRTKLFHMIFRPPAGYSHSCGRVPREEEDAQGLDLDLACHKSNPYSGGEKTGAFLNGKSHKIALQKVCTQCEKLGQQNNLLKSPNINHPNKNNAFPITV